MSLELKAELVMTVRDYKFEEKQRCDGGTDFSALDVKSNDRILLRVVTEPKTRSGVVGVDVVRTMVETMEDGNYDKGVLISERFSKAAKNEMRQESIQMISEKFMPQFNPQRLYLRIQDCVDDLCEAKCGKIPKTESDCEGKDLENHYSCKIRLISDNAAFHYDNAWLNFLQADLTQLLTLRKTINRLDCSDPNEI